MIHKQDLRNLGLKSELKGLILCLIVGECDIHTYLPECQGHGTEFIIIAIVGENFKTNNISFFFFWIKSMGNKYEL